ncbi:MAG: asparagine synthase-related protein [Nostoc sp.]
MERITGNYTKQSPSLIQSDFQINPTEYAEFDGTKLPVNGPFTVAIARFGTVTLYSSFPAEIPLYYSIDNKEIHWGELRRKLPGKVHQVTPGTAIKIGHGTKVWKHEKLKPAIAPQIALPDAIARYKELLLKAVSARLETCPSGKIGLSCSGGVDSLLIAWALKELGVDFLSFTACTSYKASDISQARRNLKAMDLAEPIPVLIDRQTVVDSIEEALILFEDIGPTQEYMRQAIAHVALARHAAAAGVTSIFNGHGQDDLMGRMRSIYKEIVGLPDTVGNAEIWRDERLRAFNDQTLVWDVNKLFSSIFRHYGIHVRMPYYDWDFMNWVLSQRLNIIPISKDKPFVQKAAAIVLPSGVCKPDYTSTGYVTGAGFKDNLSFRDFVDNTARQAYRKLFESSNVQENFPGFSN